MINLTDVNDKIYAAAARRGPSAEHAERMIAAYIADTDALGLGRPDHEPKATETIGPIVAPDRGPDRLRPRLRVRRRRLLPGPQLPRLRPALQPRSRRDGPGRGGRQSPSSRRTRSTSRSGRRGRPEEDTSWPSPWGEGRPGWHIECSAMAEELLGLDFAIHGGGSDLVFPHHENELAQTEAAREEPLAKIWMHNGMVEPRRSRAGGSEKMAKSVGNVFLLGEAIERHGAEAVVGFLVSGHYRQPIAFGDERARAGGGAQRADPRVLPRGRRPGRRARHPRSSRAARRSSTRSPTTSTPRGRWPSCSG